MKTISFDCDACDHRAEAVLTGPEVVLGVDVVGLIPCPKCGQRYNVGYWRSAVFGAIAVVAAGAALAWLFAARSGSTTLYVVFIGGAVLAAGIQLYLRAALLSSVPRRVRFEQADQPKPKKRKKRSKRKKDSAKDPDGIRAILALIRFGITAHGPKIASGSATKTINFDDGKRGFFIAEVESGGTIQYAALFAVFGRSLDDPLLVIASERKTIAIPGDGGGSHFLTATDPEMRGNHGASDDWADPDLFLERAITLAEKRLGVSRR